MKFRGVMNKANTMKEFTNIVSMISKLSKECVLRITDDKLYFIVGCDNGLPAPPVLWCELFQNMFFSEYLMTGIDEEHKDIYVRINSGNLARSLTPLKLAKSIKVKLNKKQCPCLTLEIEMASVTQQSREITHDIPITVVSRKMWGDYLRPDIPEPDISIRLPSLKHLRLAVDRMRTMATQIVIRASSDGEFNLQIKTDMAKVTTKFTGLTVETFSGSIEHTDSETETFSIDNEDASRVCFCRVDAKKLSMFLSSDQISYQSSVCSIVHKKLVILTLENQDCVKLECFISGISY